LAAPLSAPIVREAASAVALSPLNSPAFPVSPRISSSLNRSRMALTLMELIAFLKCSVGNHISLYLLALAL